MLITSITVGKAEGTGTAGSEIEAVNVPRVKGGSFLKDKNTPVKDSCCIFCGGAPVVAVSHSKESGHVHCH